MTVLLTQGSRITDRVVLAFGQSDNGMEGDRTGNPQGLRIPNIEPEWPPLLLRVLITFLASFSSHFLDLRSPVKGGPTNEEGDICIFDRVGRYRLPTVGRCCTLYTETRHEGIE